MSTDNEVDDNFPVYEIGGDIVKSFHEQFAQNQNHHQNLFIQTLAILLSVLIGYGYLYVRIGYPKSDLNISIDALYAYQAIAMYLLTIAIALISNMALGFRRDQLMAANIRIKSKVMTLGSNENYFFGTFNPQKNVGLMSWMPEFHKIFFYGLIAFKLILLLITLNFKGYELGGNFREYPLFINLSLSSLLVDIFITIYFWKKWVEHTSNAPERLKG